MMPEEYIAKVQIIFRVFICGDLSACRIYSPAACGPGYVRLTHSLWAGEDAGLPCELIILVDGKKTVLKGFTEKSPGGGNVIYWKQVEEEYVASK